MWAWKYAVAGTGTFLGLTYSVYHGMLRDVNKEDFPLCNPPAFTSIIMPTLNEEYWVTRTLLSLRNQNILRAYPDRFEIIVADSASTDRTVEMARPYATRVIDVPRGKLTAKAIAIQEAKGDVIVSVDADGEYGVNFLNLLLRHFEDPEVVGVGCSSLVDNEPLINFGYVFSNLRDAFSARRLVGRGCAFRKQAFMDIGGFNFNIDQTIVSQMVWAEEEDFATRLKQVGKVIYDLSACVVTSERMLYCPLRAKEIGIAALECPHNDPEYCARICEYCEQIERGDRF